MGVTLERVQFKFASIIGELCSEPDVLSQFAVWVDLRIAEYKTKGSISLDCSGSVPNPIWMKGVKGGPVRSGSNTGDTGQPQRGRRGSVANSPSMQHRTPVASPQMSSSQLFNERLQTTDSHWDSSGNSSHNSTQQQNVQGRLSPDIVVIKDEMGLNQPSSCAYTSGWDSTGRKRPSMDSGGIEGDYFHSSSSAKSRRVSGPSTPSAAHESSSNQSLMSIINTESPSGVTGDQGEGDASDIFKVTMEMQEELRKSQGLPASPSSATFSPRRPTATATSSGSSPSDSNLPQVQTIQGQTVWQNTAGNSSQAVFVDSEGHPLIFRPSLDLQKQASFKRHAASAVKTFHTWLMTNYPDKFRRIEKIPPEELDLFLVDFLSTIKKPNQEEYTFYSLRSVRSGLDHHLRTSGYLYSIVNHSLFRESQSAFKRKFQKKTTV